MGARPIQPETLEERLVFWAIVATWGLWLLGALYLVGPVLGGMLMLIVIGRLTGILDDGRPLPRSLPVGVVIWVIGMFLMLVALVIGHFDFELGLGQTIKSAIGWGKGWALMAIFPLAGALLSVRPAIIYRATGILALQTLMLAPVFFMAGKIGLPSHLYVSPLSMLGGPGPEFFDVTLYHIDDTDGSMRWRFFGPWSTASAFLASIGLLFAFYERSRFWQIIGIVAALVVCWMAGSRSSLVAVPLVVAAVFVAANIHRPQMLVALAFGMVGFVLMFDYIATTFEDTRDAFSAARAASSRVRATLNNIGYHRWYTEAFWFGHGVVERGPHLVEFMPIGSHHTWYGLLFVKGVAGFLALAVPIVWTVTELSLKAQADRTARSALGIMLAIAIFSFADNLEIVTYLIWPGLLLIGIGHKRRYRNPFVERMGGWQVRDEAVSRFPVDQLPGRA